MPNLFEMIFEYQWLGGKRDLDVPLSDDERARFLGLTQLLVGERADRRRAMPRVPCPQQIEFTLPGGFEAGSIKNVSGHGIAVATTRPLAVGTRTVVRIVDDAIEYFFPCVVVWQRGGERAGMGLYFDGMPSRDHLFGDEVTGVYRAIRLGGATSKTFAA